MLLWIIKRRPGSTADPNHLLGAASGTTVQAVAEEPRPMPQITVRDPGRPERSADVLVSGGDREDRPPVDPAVRRRRLRVAGAVLLLGAIGIGGLELRDRRARAAEERRLDSVVELRAEHDSGSSDFDPASGTARLDLTVLVHNDGPRDLSVTDAGVAGHRLVSGPVPVRAGRSARLLMQQVVQCAPEPPATTPPGGLRLTVRTPTGERTVEVELPTDVDEAARLCGFRPLDTISAFFSGFDRQTAGVRDLALELEARTVGPLQLVAVVPAPGIAVQLRVRGQPADLPLDLAPTADRLTRRVTVQLRLSVSDCDRAREPADADLPVPGDPQALLVQVREAAGSVGDLYVGYPDRLLDSLLDESC